MTIMLSLSLNMSYGQSFSLGGGIPYNLTAEVPGINLRAYYNIKDKICFGPELTFFAPKTIMHDDEEIKTNIWEFNWNFHYIVEVSEHLGIYPIVGFNYTQEKEDITFMSSGEDKTETINALGINIGGGFHRPLENMVPFLEYEYVLGDLSEHIITAGVFFTIGKEHSSSKEEEQ